MNLRNLVRVRTWTLSSKVIAGALLWLVVVSGQVAVDLEGRVMGETIEEQTR